MMCLGWIKNCNFFYFIRDIVLWIVRVGTISEFLYICFAVILQNMRKRNFGYKLYSFQIYCCYCVLFWKKYGFNFLNGGYLVTQRRRLRFKKNSQEIEKYQKEHAMCLVLKQHGFRVEHLSDEKKDGTYDIHLNGIPADLKRTMGFGNIIKYASEAIKKQNAKIIVFQFDDWNDKFVGKINELKRKKFHGYYFITGKEIEMYEF